MVYDLLLWLENQCYREEVIKRKKEKKMNEKGKGEKEGNEKRERK